MAIAQENIKRLFEPFYSGRSGGLGLGLTTTRSILNSHGIHFDGTANWAWAPRSGCCSRKRCW